MLDDGLSRQGRIGAHNGGAHPFAKFRIGLAKDGRLRDAGAGLTPGVWDGATYSGSRNYYNSLIPQPGRSVQLSLTLTY